MGRDRFAARQLRQPPGRRRNAEEQIFITQPVRFSWPAQGPLTHSPRGRRDSGEHAGPSANSAAVGTWNAWGNCAFTPAFTASTSPSSQTSWRQTASTSRAPIAAMMAVRRASTWGTKLRARPALKVATDGDGGGAALAERGRVSGAGGSSAAAGAAGPWSAPSGAADFFGPHEDRTNPRIATQARLFTLLLLAGFQQRYHASYNPGLDFYRTPWFSSGAKWRMRLSSGGFSWM